ncbi:hypothetical protein OAO87_00855, partial [bacterium]|nr:hypothetical protein [bacterium]
RVSSHTSLLRALSLARPERRRACEGEQCGGGGELDDGRVDNLSKQRRGHRQRPEEAAVGLGR